MIDVSFLTLVSGLILIAALIDDLKFRKVHNKLLLCCIPVALLAVVVTQGWSALLSTSLFSGLGALLIALPFYFLRIIGGGDLKLYVTVALTWSLPAVFWSLILALPWGGILGLIRAILQGKAFIIWNNMLNLIKFKKVEKEALQTFPFSVVLLLGWLSYRVLNQIGWL
ncbi:MAG: hypothetical protein OXK80_00275 [Bdellovibrionales bacterium]|nr:hypothetical protein [Bdellovibrionales bacterium]